MHAFYTWPSLFLGGTPVLGECIVLKFIDKLSCLVPLLGIKLLIVLTLYLSIADPSPQPPGRLVWWTSDTK